MKVASLKDMIKGWFVGSFEPTLFDTRDVEVAVKKYRAGDHEAWHYHKIATELTVVVEGVIRMNDREYREGEIVVIEPGEGTDFAAVTDATNVVVKIPGAVNDKYLKGQ